MLVSTRMRRMLRSRNINAPMPGTGERPLGTNETVYQYESTGRYDQEQLILGLNSRMSRTLTLFTRYFLGRAKSDTDGAGSFPANQYDLDAEYGYAGFDVRHRFILGGSVRLPGDVRVNPFVIVSSGQAVQHHHRTGQQPGHRVHGPARLRDRPEQGRAWSRPSGGCSTRTPSRARRSSRATSAAARRS